MHPWFSKRDTGLSYWINLLFPTFLYCLEQLTNFILFLSYWYRRSCSWGQFFKIKAAAPHSNPILFGIGNSFAQTCSALYPTSGMTHDACEFAGSCGNKYHYISAAPFHSAFGPVGISLCQQTQVAIVKEHFKPLIFRAVLYYACIWWVFMVKAMLWNDILIFLGCVQERKGYSCWESVPGFKVAFLKNKETKKEAESFEWDTGQSGHNSVKGVLIEILLWATHSCKAKI